MRYVLLFFLSYVLTGCVWGGGGVESRGLYKNQENGELYYAYSIADVWGIWLFVLPPICFATAKVALVSLESSDIDQKESSVALALINPMSPTLLWGEDSAAQKSKIEDIFPDTYQKVDDCVLHNGYTYKIAFRKYLGSAFVSDVGDVARLQKSESFYGVFRHELYEIPDGGIPVVVRQPNVNALEEPCVSLEKNNTLVRHEISKAGNDAE